MTSAPERVAVLRAAAQLRHDDTRRRAVEALRRLDSAGRPISFAGVAAAAGVSRAWLYRQPDLRAEIDNLRRTRGHAERATRPLRERGTPESLHQQLEALRALEAELLAENHRLREALARKLGLDRADTTR